MHPRGVGRGPIADTPAPGGFEGAKMLAGEP